MRRNTTDSCIKVKDRPFAEGSRDLQRCQSSKQKIDENNFERYAFIVNITTKSSQYLPYYIHYRRFPNRKVKIFTPPPPTIINPWLARNNGCLQLTSNLGEFCLQLFLIWFWSFWSWDWASRLPALSREWGAESTPLENNPHSMEDTDNP